MRETWEAALPGQWAAALQQGGAWQDVAPAAVTVKVGAARRGAAEARGRRGGFTLLRVSVVPLLRRPERGQLLAAGNARHDDAGGLGRLGRDPRRGRRRSSASRQGDVLRVTSPHGALELPAYVSAVDSSRGGGDSRSATATRPTSSGATWPRRRRRLNPVALLPAAAEGASGGPALSRHQGDAGQDRRAPAAGHPAGAPTIRTIARSPSTSICGRPASRRCAASR